MKTFEEFSDHYGITDQALAVEEYRRYQQELEIFRRIEESAAAEAERKKLIQFSQTKKLPRM